MIDILQFIFQSFWHFIGSLLIAIVLSATLKGIITINQYGKEKGSESKK